MEIKKCELREELENRIYVPRKEKETQIFSSAGQVNSIEKRRK
jgi:hypothetical protein